MWFINWLINLFIDFGTIDLARKVGGVDDKKTYAVKTVNAPKDEQQSNEDYLEICNNELEVWYFKIMFFFVVVRNISCCGETLCNGMMKCQT